ncbi:hypothetical protein [Nocardioides sp. InS609-2]|uniref:hypothetical protein n=1 Tax=Nocardioides sp. InS609-2 TaxID=2760705 RepID=UPI0020BE57EE|nr:hypothetical protein [Nocardioides sp. InS609-2]
MTTSNHASRVAAGVPTGGQFAASVKSEADVRLDEPAQPRTLSDLGAQPGAREDQEVEALEMAIEMSTQWRDELERFGRGMSEAKHDEAIAAHETRHQKLVNRLAYLNGHHGAPVHDRLDALSKEHRDLEKRVQLTAVQALRDLAKDAHPDAAYFTMEDSDQGDYMAGAAVFDAQGNQLEVGEWGFDDEGVGSWLSEGGHWQSERLTTPMLKERGIDNPGQMTQTGCGPFGVVFAVDPTPKP